MHRHLAFLCLMYFTPWLTSCAGLFHTRNEEALKPIQSVAIIGFVVREPAPPQVGLSLSGGGVSVHGGGGQMFRKDPAVEKIFSELVQEFGKHTHWKVTPIGAMKSNSGYQKAFDKTMKGFQNRMPPNKGETEFTPEDVMDDQSMRLLGNAGRTELIKALGVDAIVTATIQIQLNGTRVMGMGSVHPQARLSFSLFMPGKDSPDWFEGNVLGAESKVSVGTFFAVEELNNAAMQSVRSALNQIGKKS